MRADRHGPCGKCVTLRGIAVDAHGAHGKWRGQRAHQNRLSLQDINERTNIGRSERNQIGVLTRRRLRPHCVVRVQQQLLGMRRCGPQSRHSCRVVTLNAIGQREQASVIAQDPRTTARAAGHLVGHSDRTVKCRPRIAIAGIEQVVAFSDEEGPSVARECFGIGAAEDLQPLLNVSWQIGIDRFRVGRKKVARL